MVMKIFRSKKFAKRTLLALLVLIIPAFVLWGAGSMTKGPGLIGTIGKAKFRERDLQKSRAGIKAQVLFSYYADYNTFLQITRNHQLLNYMAWERLILLTEARNKRIKIPNAVVLSFISKHPLFLRDNVFNVETYNYILLNTLHIKPREFEELVRENLQVKAVREDILKDVSAPEEELKKEYRKFYGKYELSYVFVDKEPFAEEVDISVDTAKEYYEKNKDQFFEPAKTKVEYVEILYENTEEKDALMETTKNFRLKLIENPEDFQKITEKADYKYGKTEAFSRNTVVSGIPFFRDFHNAAFSIKAGKLSSLLFSSQEKGKAYILRKLEDIPQRQKDFEEVQNQIIENLTDKEKVSLAERKAKDRYKQITEENATLKKIAEGLKTEVKTTGEVSAGSYIENIGLANSIISQIQADNKEGDIITPITVKNGAVISRIDKFLPIDEADFDEKKENIEKNVITQKQIKTLEKWFAEKNTQIDLKINLEEI